jgi:hypothetical protein
MHKIAPVVAHSRDCIYDFGYSRLASPHFL